MKRLLIICLCALAGSASAQVGPIRARLIHGATKKLPMMLIEQKPRKVVLDVFIDQDGRVTRTAIVAGSGNGVFDERMRGYWKDTAFMPAIDASGQPTADTLRITNTFSIDEKGSLTLKDFRNHSDIEGNSAVDNAAHVERMKCADMLWEFDFMKKRAPKATLEHEDIFHVAFAMYLAAATVNEAARDALIGEWPKLVPRVVETCRAKPEALYLKDVFVPAFTRAAPYQSRPVD
jgi:hypothetical protein